MGSVRKSAAEVRGDSGKCSYRGGFSGDASTALSGVPLIPQAILGDEAPKARWGGFLVLHDTGVGEYDVLLDDDWIDLLPQPTASTNFRWQPATCFVPSTTAGDGVLLIAESPTAAQLAVVVASPSGGTTSAAVSSGVLTISPKSGETNAGLVTYINSSAGQTAISNACVAAAATGGTDAVKANAASVGLLFTGAQFFNGAQATGSCPSATAGDGLLFTAVPKGGAGNGIQVIVNTGSGSLSVAVQGRVITITLASGGSTNAAIAGALVASTAAMALVSVSYLTPAGSAADTMSSATGCTLSGGGVAHVQVFDAVNPAACKANGLNIPVGDMSSVSTTGLVDFHFRLLYTEGDVPTDQGGQATIFIPSTTRGDGVVISSVPTGPVAAAVTIGSTTSGDGVSFTANALGDSGNDIGVVYVGPYASALIGSTTAGSGVTYTAATAGSLGTAVQLFQAAPSGATTVVLVYGNLISIFPKTGETNNGVITAVNANTAAAALVTASLTGTGTDVVSAIGQTTINLSGGNSQGSGTVGVYVVGNKQNGSTIVVQFGVNATNAEVTTAVNTSGSASAALVTAANVGTSSDKVVVTGLTFLGTGVGASWAAGAGYNGTLGMEQADLQVIFKLGAAATPSASMSGNVCTVSLGTTNTNNTTAAIANAINEAQASTGTKMVAAYVNSSSDVFPAGFLMSATNLQCNDLIMFEVDARETSVGPM